MNTYSTPALQIHISKNTFKAYSIFKRVPLTEYLTLYLIASNLKSSKICQSGLFLSWFYLWSVSLSFSSTHSEALSTKSELKATISPIFWAFLFLNPTMSWAFLSWYGGMSCSTISYRLSSVRKEYFLDGLTKCRLGESILRTLFLILQFPPYWFWK